jgi:hypothetical protein
VRFHLVSIDLFSFIRSVILSPFPEIEEKVWNWKPWQHLERLCPEQGFYDLFKRDILLELLRRQLECECQVLYNERKLRKEALKRQFEVDFESGEVGLVD